MFWFLKILFFIKSFSVSTFSVTWKINALNVYFFVREVQTFHSVECYLEYCNITSLTSRVVWGREWWKLTYCFNLNFVNFGFRLVLKSKPILYSLLKLLITLVLKVLCYISSENLILLLLETFFISTFLVYILISSKILLLKLPVEQLFFVFPSSLLM